MTLPLLALLLIHPVSATTWVVDRAGGGNSTTIQGAIGLARSGDLIQVRAGTYTEDVDTSARNLTITGAGSATVTVRGTGSGPVLTVVGGETVQVSGLRIEGGERGIEIRASVFTGTDLVITGNAVDGNGAGLMVADAASVYLSDCTISDNVTGPSWYGGGLAVFWSQASLQDCEVSANQAVKGGGIYTEDADLNLTDTLISANTATEHGGGIRARAGSVLMATRCTVQDNTAGQRGGGASLEDSDSTWDAAVFDGNGGGTGGALYLSGQSSVGSRLDATITGNGSAGSGGAIWAWQHDLDLSGQISSNPSLVTEPGGAIWAGDLTLTLHDVEISDHAASDGGAVYLYGASLDMSRATFTDNRVVGFGGAICTEYPIQAVDCVFEDNSAGSGGGAVYVEDSASFTDCVFTGNTAGLAGGGLSAVSAITTIDQSTFTDNQATYGGGLAVMASGGAAASLDSFLSSWSGNRASSHGGGIYATALDHLFLEHASLDGNFAGTWGGGIFLLSAGQADLESTLFQGNLADQGGGLFAQSLGGGRTWDVQFWANEASDSGSGAWYGYPDGLHEIALLRAIENLVAPALVIEGDDAGQYPVRNVDISGNAGDGLRVLASAGAQVSNAILAANGGVGLGADGASLGGSYAYNDAWGNGTDWGDALGDRNGLDGNIEADPRYLSLLVDGDPATDDLRLGSTSPCRDAGDPSLTDLDGSRSDMGSYGGPDAVDGDDDNDGWAVSDGDCDDGDAAVHPGATEVWYDGIDQACDGGDDMDQDGDGSVLADDCDDTDPSVRPGAEDPGGDGIDQDCDGVDGVDTGSPDTDTDIPDTGPDETGPVDTGDSLDQDHDGWSMPEDCDDDDVAVHPGATELCSDGQDNDCNGYYDGSDGACLGDDGKNPYCGCASARAGGASWLAMLLGLSMLRLGRTLRTRP